MKSKVISRDRSRISKLFEKWNFKVNYLKHVLENYIKLCVKFTTTGFQNCIVLSIIVMKISDKMC